MHIASVSASLSMICMYTVQSHPITTHARPLPSPLYFLPLFPLPVPLPLDLPLEEVAVTLGLSGAEVWEAPPPGVVRSSRGYTYFTSSSLSSPILGAARNASQSR